LKNLLLREDFDTSLCFSDSQFIPFLKKNKHPEAQEMRFNLCAEHKLKKRGNILTIVYPDTIMKKNPKEVRIP